jgi:hypothetical protein
MGDAMSTMSNPVGLGPGGPLPAPTPWINFGSWIQYSGGVVVGSPTGSNTGPGTVNASAYFINGVPLDYANFLPLTGGVIGGNLTVNGIFTVNGSVDGLHVDAGTY